MDELAAFSPIFDKTRTRILVMNETDAGSESRWLWVVAIWMGIGLFDATQNVFVMRAEGMHHYWIRLFITLSLAWLPWMVVTPLVLWLGGRYPFRQWKRLSAWGAHLAACAATGAVYSAWVAGWEQVLNPRAETPSPAFMPRWSDKFYNGLLSYVILYCLILLVGYLLDSQKQLVLQQTETARLNDQLSKAQLNALRRQIEPHFLFNSLNAIAGLVREEKTDAAVGMIAELSDFLRRVVEDSDRQEVALREELEFTRKYLEIQKVRFAERLKFSLDVPAELLSAQVPTLILQPMVENAVKHGISKRAQGGAVRVAAFRSNGTLTVTVSNDGPSLPGGWETKQMGVGMLNVRTRLRNLYGDAFSFHLRNREPEGVEALISVPFVAPAANSGRK
jgi:two-component system, LytTR family, sensor kinase